MNDFLNLIEELEAEEQQTDLSNLDMITEEEEFDSELLDEKFEKIEIFSENKSKNLNEFEKTIKTIVDETLSFKDNRNEEENLSAISIIEKGLLKKRVSFSKQLENTYLFKETNNSQDEKHKEEELLKNITLNTQRNYEKVICLTKILAENLTKNHFLYQKFNILCV